MKRKDGVHSDDRLVHELLEGLADEPVPDVAPGVMWRIEALSAPERHGDRVTGRVLGRVRTALGWLWRPRPITVPLRPAVVAAVAVVALWVALPPAVQRDAVPEVPSVFVQFRLDVSEAQEVRLAGDFTDWQPAHELRQVAPGTWTVVVPMQPGVHEYAFVIDGDRWTADPVAEQVTDGFGGVNSRVAVLVPERSEAL